MMAVLLVYGSGTWRGLASTTPTTRTTARRMVNFSNTIAGHTNTQETN